MSCCKKTWFPKNPVLLLLFFCFAVGPLRPLLAEELASLPNPLPEAELPATDALEDLPLIEAPTLYSGFANLLDDDEILTAEELIDVKADVKKLALYYTGDRLHRSIPKQTFAMVENKLISKIMDLGRFEILECVECRITKVSMLSARLSVRQAAETNQDLRNLAKRIRVDAFLLWNAGVHDNKFTVNLRLVEARSSKILWLQEYTKKTTKEQEEQNFEIVKYELAIGALNIGAERRSETGNQTETLNGFTTFAVRRREASSKHDQIEYTLGLEYFTNISNTDYFDLSGFIAEGRVIVDVEALSKLVETRVYMGVGQAFYNDTHNLLFRFGFEFPFAKNGFMNLGVGYLPSSDVRWKSVDNFEEETSFGGANLDLTLGFRF